MRTTISVDDGLMDELMRIEPGVTRSEAVRRAISEYVYQKRVDEFLAFARTRPIDLDWREMRRQSIEHAQNLERRWNANRGVRQRSRAR